jgi:hypothetical protein
MIILLIKILLYFNKIYISLTLISKTKIKNKIYLYKFLIKFLYIFIYF